MAQESLVYALIGVFMAHRDSLTMTWWRLLMSLSMCISDKIEVATIPNKITTISEIEAKIYMQIISGQIEILIA